MHIELGRASCLDSRDLEAMHRLRCMLKDVIAQTLGSPVRHFGMPVQVGATRSVARSIDVNLNTLLLLLRQRAGGATLQPAMAA